MNKKVWKLLFLIIFLFAFLATSNNSMPARASNVTATILLQNNTLFSSTFGGASFSVGDVTNDGVTDIVLTKGNGAQAAVFQQTISGWDSGTLLAGPNNTNASNSFIAPIRNDGNQWLVYSEHRHGNTGEWLRAHRYQGTTLIENKDITSRFAWPGWFEPTVADMNNDGNLEIWFISYHGLPTLHLRVHEWDAATQSYPGFEIKDGGYNHGGGFRTPLVGDFLNNNTQSLVWSPDHWNLDLVTYSPGTGVNGYTSTPIFTLPGGNETIFSYAAGEFDGLPGKDIIVVTIDSTDTTTSLYLISGGTFNSAQLISGIDVIVKDVCLGDLDGDGLAEIYAAIRYSTSGKIFSYDLDYGWREIAQFPGYSWWDCDTVNWDGASQEEALFSGSILGTKEFIVVSLTAPLSNQPPTADSGGPYHGDERMPIFLNGATATDPDGDELNYSWTVNSPDCIFDDPTLMNPTLVCDDNGFYQATLTVSDGVNDPVSDTADVSIANLAPENCLIDAPMEPVSAGTEINTVVSFTDPGVLDTHTVTWDWGDSIASDAVVSESNGSGSATGSHIYTAAGVYTVTALVTDKDGDSCNPIFEYIVVYDPEGGFVTGGGWINSPEGAFAADPLLTGKATFGFVSKYKKGATVPSGNTEFQFKAGDLNFHSSDYDWLVVTGSDYARFKGTGTINGGGEYKFMIWAGDGELDTFRIKIWEEIDGVETVIYDNGMDQEIGGGSIVVHTKLQNG